MKLSKSLTLPADLASQTIALLGIRGSGKTNTAGVIVEELFEIGQQVCVIDPTDVWWGLRSSANGKDSGYPVLVIGGEHGDIPLTEADGKTIADFIVAECMPCILSIRHLRKNAQRRFVTDLSEELFHLKGKVANRTPLTVIIDEAPLFCPQAVQADVSRCVGSIEDLVARGRSGGFGVVLISQRAATINKNVLTQADTIVAHRLTGPQDRKALKDWFEENASIEQMNEVLGSLAALKNGEAWVWSPLLDVFKRDQIRLKKTFDSSFTPKIGQKATAPRKLAEVDLSKLKGKLASSIEEAKANDPAELKNRIKELEKLLAAKPAVAVDDREIKRMIADAVKQRDEEWQPVRYGLTIALNQLADIANMARISDTIPEGPVKFHKSEAAPRKQVDSNGRKPTAESQSLPNGDLPKGERAILIACAQHPEGCDRTQLSILTGYKRSSRDAYIQRLREKGMLKLGDPIQPNEAGLAAIGDGFEPLPTGYALLEHWLLNLPEGERKVLEFVAAESDAVSREAISDATDYKRSSRDAYIQRLKARKLVETGSFGVRASDMLFD